MKFKKKVKWKTACQKQNERQWVRKMFAFFVNNFLLRFILLAAGEKGRVSLSGRARKDVDLTQVFECCFLLTDRCPLRVSLEGQSFPRLYGGAFFVLEIIWIS